jgi:hypothetical protein
VRELKDFINEMMVEEDKNLFCFLSTRTESKIRGFKRLLVDQAKKQVGDQVTICLSYLLILVTLMEFKCLKAVT